MSGRIEVEYRGYIIVAMDLKGQPTARVLYGKTIASKDLFVGSSIDEAVNASKAWVDRARTEAGAKRRKAHIGSVEDYERYLTMHPLTEKQRLMLTAHAKATDRILTAGELAAAAGWEDYNPANRWYGGLGEEVATFLDLDLLRRPDGSRVGTSALADSADPDWKPVDGYFRWQMHPELAEALRRLKIV